MSTTNDEFKYFVGTRAQFDYLVTAGKILDSYLIFISDTHEIYKGTVRYSSDNFVISNVKPDQPRDQVLYSINGILEIYNKSTGWTELSKPFSMELNSNSTDETVPTSKAVMDAINEAISNLHVSEGGGISGVTSTKVGTITITKNAEEQDVPIKGVVTNPTYDEESRTLTLPVVGEDTPFQISFGKDVHIESGYFNELNNSIQLTRSDGEVISVGIPTISGSFDVVPSDTSSISMSIVDGVLSADVKISQQDGNIIEIKKDGLYVSKQEQAGVTNKVIIF